MRRIVLVMLILCLSISAWAQVDSTQPAKPKTKAQIAQEEAKAKRDADAAKRKEQAAAAKDAAKKRLEDAAKARKDADSIKKSKPAGPAGGHPANAGGGGLTPAEQREATKKKLEEQARARKEADSTKKANMVRIKHEQDSIKKVAGPGAHPGGAGGAADAKRKMEEAAKARKEADSTKKAQVAKLKHDQDSVKIVQALAKKEADSTKKAELSTKTMTAQQKKEADLAKKQQAAQDKKEADAQLKSSGALTEDKKVVEHPKPEKKAPPVHNKPGKNEPVVVADPLVVNIMCALPIDALPQVKKWITDKEETDSRDLRKGFINNKTTGNPNYVHLQKPAEDRYTNVQAFTSAKMEFVAIETTDCHGECDNSFTLYKKNGEVWEDVTISYLPVMDKKSILNRIKDKYKKDFGDLDLYDAKNYAKDEAVYKKALMFNIMPDGTIAVRDQYLRPYLPVMNIVWNPDNSTFEAKKP